MAELKKTAREQMLFGRPFYTLIRFALPMIAGNLLQQFYSVIDSVVVGRVVGEEALAAIGVSNSITNILIMVALGFGMGLSVVVSQFFGAEKYREMKSSVSTAGITMIALGLGIGLAGFIFCRPLLFVLNTPANVLDQAKTYLSIYFIGLPLVFIYNLGASILNALGDSKTPLFLLIFSSLLNIALDLLMTMVFAQGVKGVALATLIAQGLAALGAVFLVYRNLNKYSNLAKIHFFDLEILKQILRLALPAALQLSVVSIGALLVQAKVNTFGSSVLAGYAAAIRIEAICIVPLSSIGSAGATFTAINLGAGKSERISQGRKVSLACAAFVSLLLFAVLFPANRFFISLFMDDLAQSIATEAGTAYLKFMSAFFFLFGLKIIYDSLLRGKGLVLVSTAANLLNLALRVVFVYSFAEMLGYKAVYYSVPLAWFLNYIVSFIGYKRSLRKENALVLSRSV